MNLKGVPQFNYMLTADGRQLRCKLLDIGSWNMDTTADKTVAHGLDITLVSIIDIQVMIERDGGLEFSPLNGINPSLTPSANGGVQYFNTSLILLHRNDGGNFDNAFYDGAQNRGYVAVWYIVK